MVHHHHYIIYFSLYVVLILALSIYIHQTEKEQYNNKKDFLRAVWSRRGIYGQILVHLYDTATDIGVLIECGLLAYDPIDYQSIDMQIMFWTSIGFLIFYRFISTIFACLSGLYEEDGYLSNCCLGIIIGYVYH